MGQCNNITHVIHDSNETKGANHWFNTVKWLNIGVFIPVSKRVVSAAR